MPSHSFLTPTPWQLQVFFGYQAKIICKHPSRCIWGVMLWMALVLPASLLGNVELRNEEVLVSKTYASRPLTPHHHHSLLRYPGPSLSDCTWLHSCRR